MPPGSVFPMEYGFERMGAIDFQKGCFVGQEVTSRVHRKGSLRKTLHPAVFDAAVPPAGTPVMNEDSKVGEVVAGLDGNALVLVRTDALTASLRADGCTFRLKPGLFRGENHLLPLSAGFVEMGDLGYSVSRLSGGMKI